jgi:predicted DNA binding CopG/RHH family protein
VTERDVKASKKATVNLFIDENVIGELKKEADYHGISLNAKVSSILT